ncbi:MAG TPA: Ku protein [Solirubrobacterales bacterium]|nr:Ku protein [Solirubrobacterales bacterium]
MPRAKWKGTIGFGLVNVPVELIPAARDLDYHFRELHEKDSAPVRRHRFCSKENKEVSWDEIGRGIEVDGKMVVLTDADLESVQPERNQTIEIESFTDIDEIDPIYFDQPYFLAPANRSAGTLRAYRLLVTAMAESEQVALGRFVMHTKEYLAAVREREGALALSTMRFPDEVRSVDMLPEIDAEPDPAAIDDAVAVIDELSTEWEPAKYEDHYRLRLRKVIDSRRKGRTVTAPEPREEDLSPAPDLMAALRKTLESSGKKRSSSKRKRSPASKKPAGAKQAAKKSTKKTAG